MKIVIVGAGIGGLITALSLEAAGFRDIEIYERSSAIRGLGVGLNLLPHALRELSEPGIGQLKVHDCSGHPCRQRRLGCQACCGQGCFCEAHARRSFNFYSRKIKDRGCQVGDDNCCFLCDVRNDRARREGKEVDVTCARCEGKEADATCADQEPGCKAGTRPVCFNSRAQGQVDGTEARGPASQGSSREAGSRGGRRGRRTSAQTADRPTSTRAD